MRLDDVVARVQRAFGDRQILSASVDGSRLSVKLALTAHGGDAAPTEDVFEAQVLGHAVADWLRMRGEKPVTAVRSLDSRGRVIPGSLAEGDPIESDPGVAPLSATACESAAERAATGPLRLDSARTLPYLHGTCVFVLRTSRPLAGSRAAMGALGRMIHAVSAGAPNLRPWFFELVGRGGVPVSSAAWMPGDGGTTWARPGYAYAMAHG